MSCSISVKEWPYPWCCSLKTNFIFSHFVLSRHLLQSLNNNNLSMPLLTLSHIYIYIYIFFFRFFSIIGYYKILSIVRTHHWALTFITIATDTIHDLLYLYVLSTWRITEFQKCKPLSILTSAIFWLNKSRLTYFHLTLNGGNVSWGWEWRWTILQSSYSSSAQQYLCKKTKRWRIQEAPQGAQSVMGERTYKQIITEESKESGSEHSKNGLGAIQG